MLIHNLCLSCVLYHLFISYCQLKAAPQNMYLYMYLNLNWIFWEDLKRKMGFYIWGFPLSWNKIQEPKVENIFNFYMLRTDTNTATTWIRQILAWNASTPPSWWILFCNVWCFVDVYVLSSGRSGSKSKWGWFCRHALSYVFCTKSAHLGAVFHIVFKQELSRPSH